jgi:hypothetical protein
MGDKLVIVVMLVKVGRSVEITEEKPESEEMVELSEEGSLVAGLEVKEIGVMAGFTVSGDGTSSCVVGSPVDKAASTGPLVKTRSLGRVEDEDCEMVRCLRAATIAAACSANVGCNGGLGVLAGSADGSATATCPA